MIETPLEISYALYKDSENFRQRGETKFDVVWKAPHPVFLYSRTPAHLENRPLPQGRGVLINV